MLRRLIKRLFGDKTCYHCKEVAGGYPDKMGRHVCDTCWDAGHGYRT